jgi:hypothetical protein
LTSTQAQIGRNFVASVNFSAFMDVLSDEFLSPSIAELLLGRHFEFVWNPGTALHAEFTSLFLTHEKAFFGVFVISSIGLPAETDPFLEFDDGSDSTNSTLLQIKLFMLLLLDLLLIFLARWSWNFGTIVDLLLALLAPFLSQVFALNQTGLKLAVSSLILNSAISLP